jgi:hypothetical protein
MSSASTQGASPSRSPLVIILAVIGILAIIAGILYVSGAANSLHFMIGAKHKGHHQVRAIVSFVVGIAFLIGAYVAKSRPAAGSRGNVGSTGSTGSTDRPSASTDPSGSTDRPSGSATPSGT